MDTLAARLVEIGRVPDPDIERASRYLGDAQEEARQIGWELHEVGSMGAMQAAHAEVARQLGGPAARELELAWDRIGDWVA
jgi:hypothetical protein